MQRDNIFYNEIWGNIYLKNTIISFLKLKTTKDQLPKYRGKSNGFNIKIVGKLGESRKYNYYERREVNKMAMYNKELLRDKIKNGEKNLLFQKNPGIVIFSCYKDTTDKEFYYNLFKNYSIYFTNQLLSLEITIESIIIMDCLVALLQLVSNYHNDDDKDGFLNFNHYLLSIKYGSVEISNYLSKKFNFKLTELNVLKLVNDIFNIDYCSSLKEGLVFFTKKEFQIKIFGYLFISSVDSEISYFKIKSLKLLSKITIDQNISFSTINQSTTTSTITTPIIKPMIDFSIKEKPLQFFLDVCYSIHFFSRIINIKDYVDSDELGELSLQKLNEISQKSNEQELKVRFEDFEPNREDIKKLVQLGIQFSRHGMADNLTNFKVKYEKNIIGIDNRFLNTFALNCGLYKIFISNKWPASPNIYHQTINLFKFCKKDSFFKKEFVKQFINDISKENNKKNKPPNENENNNCSNNYNNDNDNDNNNNNNCSNEQPFDQYDTLKIRSLHILFKTFISYGDLELLKMIVQSIDQELIHKDFLCDTGNDLLFIQDENVFDLLYQCEHLKESFNFKKFLENSKDSIKYYDTSNILNHFKLKYPIDYYRYCENLSTSFGSNQSLWFSKFVIKNIQDFKNVIPSNYWDFQIEEMDLSTRREDSLSKLWKFLILLETKPNDRQYSDKENLEFFTWIFKNRKEDIDSGKCIVTNNLIFLEYYYYSDQISLMPFNLLSNNNIRQLFSFVGSNILKDMIRYQDLEDFQVIFHHLYIKFKENALASDVVKFKYELFFYISKYNSLEILKFINENDKSFFLDLGFYPNNISSQLSSVGSIEVINYLFNEMNFKYDREMNHYQFHWMEKELKIKIISNN